jgi:peptide/nickel transport system substrate-binding protein
MKRMFTVIVVLTAAALLASCAAGDFLRGTAEKFFVSEKTDGDDNVQDIQPEETKTDNSITVGVLDFDTYNPLATKSSTVKEVCGFVFEGLFGLDSSFRTLPSLAQSYTVSPDGKGISISIKNGVTWHDSTPFTVDDVLYTIDYIRSEQTAYSYLLEAVDGAWKQDENTLCVSFSRSVPDSVSLFIFPIIKKGSAAGEFDFVGTGPYMISSPAADTVLTAYANYHGGSVGIERIYVKRIPDKEKYISLFNAGEINIATSEILDMTSFMPKSNAKVYDYVSNNMVFVGFNTASSKLNDAKTRRALSMLIDRDLLISRTYFSLAAASEYPVNPSSWLNTDARDKIRSDDSGALALLTEAGWTADNRGRYYRSDGKKLSYLTLTLLVNSDDDKRSLMAEDIAAKLSGLGIPTDVRKCPSAEFSASVLQKNYELFIGETELPPNNDLTSLVSSNGNYFNYANADVDVLLSQMGTVQLESDVKAVADVLYETLREESPFAPICFKKESIVTSAKIKSGVNPSIESFVRESANWMVK